MKLIRKIIGWAYLKFVYLPELKKKLKQMYPGVDISIDSVEMRDSFTVESDSQMKQAEIERRWIADRDLN